VPHVELSLTDLGATAAPHPPDPASRDPFARWAAAVVDAVEPSLLIDRNEIVVAMSLACVVMLGLDEAPVGKPLCGDTLNLIDFSSQAGALADVEIGKIPPLLSLKSGRLARGLIRVECDGAICTLDAIATPIGGPGRVAGSLTFFSPV
jgi:hypothetical protein